MTISWRSLKETPSSSLKIPKGLLAPCCHQKVAKEIRNCGGPPKMWCGDRNSCAIIAVTASSAVMSFLGSSLICYHVIVQPKQSSLFLLLLGLCVADQMNSLRCVLAPLLTYPQKGPSMSCTVDGFFTILGFLGPYYNAALSYYYFAIVVRETPPHQYARWGERISHILCWGYAVIAAVSGIILKTYNPNFDELGWFIAPYPVDCLEEEDEGCVQGEWAFLHNFLGSVIPICSVLLLLIFCNLSMYSKVRGVEQRVQRYVFHPSSQENTVPSLSVTLKSEERTMPTPTEPQRSNSGESRQTPSQSQQVARQGFLYVACYGVSWFFVFIMFITKGKNFVVQILMSVFYPGQGVMNALVFVAPRVQQRKQCYPDESRWYAIRKACVERKLPVPKVQKQAGRIVVQQSRKTNRPLVHCRQILSSFPMI